MKSFATRSIVTHCNKRFVKIFSYILSLIDKAFFKQMRGDTFEIPDGLALVDYFADQGVHVAVGQTTFTIFLSSRRVCNTTFDLVAVDHRNDVRRNDSNKNLVARCREHSNRLFTLLTKLKNSK